MKLSERQIAKLTEEDVQELLATYARKRESAIRDQIVMQYANLVESVARRFMGSCEPVEDLVQEGYIGLITAVDGYDATKGVKFSTYATHFVIGQIKHYLRDKGKIIKEPAWLQELNQRMTKVIESLAQQNGRPPSEKEIGEVMDLPEETVADLLTTREVFKVSSLDAGTDRDDGSSSAVDTEKIKDVKCASFQLPLEDKIVLQTAMDHLKSVEQKVIHDFFYLDLNQTEIARKLGISCNYVSHILRNSTKKLKKILMTEELKDAQMQVAQLSKRVQDQAQKLEQYTVVDPLTGIYNRNYFNDRLEEEISRAYRSGHSVSIVLIHVELPESVDKLMRLIRSDDILMEAAERLRLSIRRADVLSRFQDNVFGVILPHAGVHAPAIANRLEGIIASKPLASSRGNDGISVEVTSACVSYPEEVGSAKDLISTAVEALGITDDEQSIPKAA